MKKLYSLLVLSVLIAGLKAQSTHLISATLIDQFTTSDIQTYLDNQGVPSGMVAITNPLKVYKITYATVSYDSTATIATGVVFMPDSVNGCRKPIVSYDHGTTIKKADAPSNKVGEYVIGIAFGANGWIVSMPDYLGLGDGPGLHPYHHAHSEATATVDMIRASKEWMDSLNYNYSDQLFLTGYSQGGHAALATQRMIEQELSSEFTVTASGPLSGAYDVSGIQAEVITRDSIYDSPGYLPFIMFSYNMVYNMYPSWDLVLDTPYYSTIPPLMDGSVSLGAVEAIMPDTPNLILIPALLDSFETVPNHPFRVALRDNDLYNWAPQAPTRFGYCTADKLVSYQNAIFAADTMTALGAPDVQAVLINASLGHQDCAVFALYGINNFFRNYRQDLLNLSFDITDATTPSSTDGSIAVNITGGVGAFTYNWSNGNTTSSASGLGYGSYSVTVTDANGCSASASANLGVVGIDEEQNTGSVFMYPNPASGAFTVAVSNVYNDYHITVTDMLGKQVYSRMIGSSVSSTIIDASAWSEGVYMVSVNTGSKNITYKLIIR